MDTRFHTLKNQYTRSETRLDQCEEEGEGGKQRKEKKDWIHSDIMVLFSDRAVEKQNDYRLSTQIDNFLARNPLPCF